MAKIVDHLIYETEQEHDDRIARENLKFYFDKKRSRSKARNVTTRRRCFLRADSKCEICLFDFSSILILHHIMPVKLGGSAHHTNLIVLCPNCHGLVHNYSHHRKSKERVYPAWMGALMRTGLTEAQALRLISVAAKDVKILLDGSIVLHNVPDALVSIIVDGNGKPVHPRHDPSRIEAALQAIEKRFGIGNLLTTSNPVGEN